MTRAVKWKSPVLAGLIAALCGVAGCTTTSGTTGKARTASLETTRIHTVGGVKTYTYTPKDRECLERAMFFESNRSSPDGLLAVGTVVMNRLVSGRYSDTICGVVGQKGQFAPGVLTRRMESGKLPDVEATADAVLKGKRHPALKNAMFFHTAGLTFPYRNMHYVLVAGGNSFYEKRNRDGSLQSPVPDTPYNLALAYTPQSPSMPQGPSYDVTTQGAAPSVQVALAEAAQASAPVQPGFGPQARGDRLARHRMTPAQQQAEPQQVESRAQLASYEPQFDASAPAAAQPAQSSLGFAPDKKRIDAIGAMLLTQDRPESPL